MTRTQGDSPKDKQKTSVVLHTREPICCYTLGQLQLQTDTNYHFVKN